MLSFNTPPRFRVYTVAKERQARKRQEQGERGFRVFVARGARRDHGPGATGALVVTREKQRAEGRCRLAQTEPVRFHPSLQGTSPRTRGRLGQPGG